MKELFDRAGDAMAGSAPMQDYADRHGVVALPMLTIIDDEMADLVAESLRPQIEGRTVVEIGGGIGLLALHMGFRARRVYCIEANPLWAASFLSALMAVKPKNVSFLFGAADEFAGQITADVAVFCTHSGVENMRAAASLFAPTVIDVYGEMIARDPEKFDRLARTLRPMA